MAPSSSSSSSSSSSKAIVNVFETGNHKTVLKRVDTGKGTKETVPPPKPHLIALPEEEGQFPVLLFIHGYLLYNSFYSQLIQHIASHGFIVIAPQLYEITGADTNDDIKSTAAITNWLPKGLQGLLPLNVQANLSKLALAGHSRGGKTSFALALRKELTALKFSALIGIDPVDGMDEGKQTSPPVLTYVPHSFDLDHMAVMVVGAGLSEAKKNPLFPPCAPKGVNHEEFYRECRKPACYFVAKDYGHFDMLDDEAKGIRGDWLCDMLCEKGKSRELMRKFVGGIVVSFMKAYLEFDSSSLIAIRDGKETTPVELQTVEFIS